MGAYKFVTWDVPPKPDNEITRLLEKAQRKELLSRQERDRVAELLYGLFGGHGPIYKLAGWAWDMSTHLPRILVSFRWDGGRFESYYAPDKTALRKALPYPVREMVYASRRGE